jgi:hypothetical protein
MATKTIVTRVCDMPHVHAGDEPAEPYELYSKRSGRYEVDLCEVCATKIFATVVVNGRKVGRK